MIVSFDFDDTITKNHWSFDGEKWTCDESPHLEIIEKIKAYHEDGHKVIITTYRRSSQEHLPDRKPISAFINKHKLPIFQVVFTEHEDKAVFLHTLGVSVHHDDDLECILGLDKWGIHGILVTNGKSVDQRG